MNFNLRIKSLHVVCLLLLIKTDPELNDWSEITLSIVFPSMCYRNSLFEKESQLLWCVEVGVGREAVVKKNHIIQSVSKYGYTYFLNLGIKLLPPLPPSARGGQGWRRCETVGCRHLNMAAEQSLQQYGRGASADFREPDQPQYFFRDAKPLVTAKLDLSLNEVSAAVGQGHKSHPAGPLQAGLTQRLICFSTFGIIVIKRKPF